MTFKTMVRRHFWFILLIGVVSGVTYLGFCKLIALPRLEVPSEINLGIVDSGSSVETTIRVRNISTTEVRLFDFSSSCSCTVPRIKELILPPGGFSDIPVQVRTIGPNGAYEEIVVFRVGDKGKKRKVHIRAEIRQLITINPRRWTLLPSHAKGSKDVLQSQKIRILAADNNFKIADFKIMQNPYFHFIKINIKHQDVDSVILLCDLSSEVPSGEIQGEIGFEVTSVDGRKVRGNLKFGGLVKEDFTSRPSVLFLRNDENKLKYKIEITPKLNQTDFDYGIVKNYNENVSWKGILVEGDSQLQINFESIEQKKELVNEGGAILIRSKKTGKSILSIPFLGVTY